MHTLLHPLLSLLLFAFVGGCLFLLILNRWLLMLEDCACKTPGIAILGLLLIGGGGLAGYQAAGTLWLYLPVTLLGLLCLGEIYGRYIRYRHRGSPPLDTTPNRISLTSPVTTTDLMIHRYKLTTSKVKNPIRIVHITDIHADQRIPWEYYHKTLRAAAELAPDIVVFTGDFIGHIKALPCLADITKPMGKYGTFAVLGNHDYWVGPDLIQEALIKNGITVLRNETRTARFGETVVTLSGYDYPWGTQNACLTHKEQNHLHLVLTHTPDNIYRVLSSSPDLVFAGHYHAGQVRLPLRGSLVVPSIYGCRFDHGHFVFGSTHLFVSSGIGASGAPIRIYCQPDIFVVDLDP